MFEKLEERGLRVAERLAGKKIRIIEERLRDELPPGVRAEADDDGVRLSGSGLLRRFVRDPRLRHLIEGVWR